MTPAPSRPCTKCGGPRDTRFSSCRACRSAHAREYQRRPEVRAHRKAWNAGPNGQAARARYLAKAEVREKVKVYSTSPEVLARRRAAYATKPEIRERAKRYNDRPDSRARRRERESTPEGLLRRNIRDAERYARKVAGTGREPWIQAGAILLRCQLARLIEAKRPDLKGLHDAADLPACPKEAVA